MQRMQGIRGLCHATLRQNLPFEMLKFRRMEVLPLLNPNQQNQAVLHRLPQILDNAESGQS